jgi:hypothetical protein
MPKSKKKGSTSRSRRTPPWDRPAPRDARHHRLSPRAKATAKRRARKAGRPYPNLVDNLQAARDASGSRPSTRTRPRAKAKRARPGGSASRRLRDPHGGLTAAGRRHFARTEGARLRPGVKGADRELSPAEQRRKGSWAVRFYGRKGRLPALRDADGQPTRFALTAAAWGEPVPRTAAAARRIAAKGRRLLAQYRASR